MTDDNAWRKRMRACNPEALRELNRRYYRSPAGQAAVRRKYQKKRDVVAAEREARGNVCLDCRSKRRAKKEASRGVSRSS